MPQQEDKHKIYERAQMGHKLGYGKRPAIVVIDRVGVVRASGVKVEKVKELAGKLLAESTRKKEGVEGGVP